MIRHTLTIPAADSNGSPLDARQLSRYEAELARIGGGFTAAPETGGWLDPDGDLVTEPVTVVSVDTDDSSSAELAVESIAHEVRRDLHQTAVYVTSQPIQATSVGMDETTEEQRASAAAAATPNWLPSSEQPARHDHEQQPGTGLRAAWKRAANWGLTPEQLRAAAAGQEIIERDGLDAPSPRVYGRTIYQRGEQPTSNS